MKRTRINEQGFSLAEVMVAAGLAGVVFLFATQFFTIVNKDSEKSKDRLLKSLNKLQFEQIIRYDLSAAKPSFGTMDYPDDKDQNFFDYFFDAPCAAADCTREVTLEMPATEGAYSKSFYMMITDNLFKKELVYDPKEAYSNTGLTFDSINRNNILGLLTPSPWDAGSLMLLYSKYAVRDDSTKYDLEPPKLVSYLGWLVDVNNKTLKYEPIKDDKEAIYYFRGTKPVPGTDISTNTEDKFFRNIPYLEGLPTEVYLSRVKIVRFRVQTIKEKGILYGKVLRGTKNVGGDYREIAIADKVKFLKFQRSNISTPQITINLQSCDKKGLEEKRLCL